ncbi:hypothetical protein C7N83_04340, partial [Neisseria iguanae]
TAIPELPEKPMPGGSIVTDIATKIIGKKPIAYRQSKTIKSGWLTASVIIPTHSKTVLKPLCTVMPKQ